MSLSTYRKYEYGDVADRVPFSAIESLAAALGVTCQAFAGLAPPTPPPTTKPKPKKPKK